MDKRQLADKIEALNVLIDKQQQRNGELTKQLVPSLLAGIQSPMLQQQLSLGVKALLKHCEEQDQLIDHYLQPNL